MRVTFDKEYLRDLFQTGKSSSKKHRFQPEIVRKYRHCINILLNAKNIDALRGTNSLNYEILQGDKAGISSIRVNIQYRIEFTVNDSETEPFITICNILELSNHYK